LDLKQLEKILQILDEKQIMEFELEEEGMKLRIRKSPSNHSPSLNPALPGAPPGVPPLQDGGSSNPPSKTKEEEGLFIVKSPIVGTFYRAAEPSAAPFVNVGDHVRTGQVLCIIEAMKLMNEIEAEVSGEVLKIHHESGQPVQYAEPLFSIRPDR